jgi:hypothetical protein
MRGHADRTGTERIVRFGRLFRFRRFLHQCHGVGVAIERAIDPGVRDLELDGDLSCPVQVLRVGKRLLQCREPFEIGACVLRSAAAGESDCARKMRYRFRVRVTARPQREVC